MPPKYISNIQFVKSITEIKDKPFPKLPEIAVVGRSNVGKSSLINSIFNQKKLAKISSTPGKTRLINYFEVENKLYFVDLPGYGFAKVAKSESDKWKEMIENYLKNNKELVYVFLLIDSRRGIMTIDKSMMDWLDYYKINYNIILTKIDKLSNNELNKTKSDILKKINSDTVFTFSSKSEKGRIEVLNLLNYTISKII